jgi:proteic killer suppression protein
MEIVISDKRLRKVIDDNAACRRQYGENMAKKLALRLASLRAAESLAAFWPPNSGPERCHELKGDRKGTFSVDLNQPFRLLFQATKEPSVADGEIRWKSITSIDITSIEDTHG